MKHKRTGILVVILLVLGLYVYLFEVNPKNKEEAKTAEIEKPLVFNVKDVREIVLIDNSQGVLLQNIDGQWKMKQPKEADVDAKKVSDLFDLFNLGIVRVIDPNPPDISLFGLDRPRFEFGIKAAGDDSFQTLIIGDDSPGNLSCYAKVRGQTKVLLLGIRYRQEFTRVFKDFSKALDSKN